MGFFQDLISPISDHEHPLSLGELAVVNLPHIKVTDKQDRSAISHVLVEITPTITHCSLATVIGLGIRVRLEQALSPRFRLDVRIREGTHTVTGAPHQYPDRRYCLKDGRYSIPITILSP